MTVLATYRKQTIQPETLSRLVVLKRTVMKLDPTRTTTLRNSFVAEVDKRFNALKKLITEAIVDRDCFGLKPGNEGKLITFAVPGANQNDPLPAKEQYKFNTSSEKVDEFMEWLNTQEEKGILQTTRLNQVGTAAREPWTNVYITDSYKKGRQRAIYEMKGVGMQPPEGMGISMGFAANTPFHADRVGLLYTRTFNDLKGIDQAMDSQISRILAQGLADGDGPKELARKINQKVDGIGKNRARTLARTEVIRAHHSGMIGEYRNWGAIGVKVQAEWVTAGFNVCPECQAMEGKEFTLDQIEGMIPKHPNCRCMALPTMPEKGIKSVDKVKDSLLSKEQLEAMKPEFLRDLGEMVGANQPLDIKKYKQLIDPYREKKIVYRVWQDDPLKQLARDKKGYFSTTTDLKAFKQMADELGIEGKITMHYGEGFDPYKIIEDMLEKHGGKEKQFLRNVIADNSWQKELIFLDTIDEKALKIIGNIDNGLITLDKKLINKLRIELKTMPEKGIGKPVIPEKKTGNLINGDIFSGKDPYLKQLLSKSNYSAIGEDLWLKAIAKRQGFDNKPTKVPKSVFDANKGEMLFRGVTKEEYVKDFIEGEYWGGKGATGNGYYFVSTEIKGVGKSLDSVSTAERVALHYAEGNNKGVMGAKLVDSARIIDYDELIRIRDDELKEAGFTFKKISDAVDAGNLSNTEAGNIFKVYNDVGRFAAAKGYDAIRVINPLYNDFLVVLNRGKILISD